MGDDKTLILSEIKGCPDFSLTMAENLKLKPLKTSDITDAYIEGLNDPDVNRFLVGPGSEVQTYKTVHKFVDHNFSDPNAILFGFYINNILCGTCRVHEITHNSAYMGLAIFDKSEWGKGHGTSIINSVVDFCRKVLTLTVVKAGIEAGNKGSSSAFRKSGFSIENQSDQSQVWAVNLGS